MTTEPMAALYAALASARGAIANPKKGSKANAGQYSYTYADLAAVLDSVTPILAEHGLAALQDVRTNVEAKTVEVSTIIVHASGGWIEFGPLAFPATSNPQQTGSAITYARRYTLSAALGIAAEDDDGKAASEPREKITRSSAPRSEDPWTRDTPPVPAATVDVGTRRGPAAKRWATAEMTADQEKTLTDLVAATGSYSSLEDFLTSPDCARVLGGEPSRPLVIGHASTLIDALLEWRNGARK
jgi:hypothetical protein